METWEQAGVTDDIRTELHSDLLRNTVDNILSLGPQAALTGPAARGDLDAVGQQHAALAGWNAEAAEVYARLSQMATRLKTSARTV